MRFAGEAFSQEPEQENLIARYTPQDKWEDQQTLKFINGLAPGQRTQRVIDAEQKLIDRINGVPGSRNDYLGV